MHPARDLGPGQPSVLSLSRRMSTSPAIAYTLFFQDGNTALSLSATPDIANEINSSLSTMSFEIVKVPDKEEVEQEAPVSAARPSITARGEELSKLGLVYKKPANAGACVLAPLPLQHRVAAKEKVSSAKGHRTGVSQLYQKQLAVGKENLATERMLM